MPTIANVLKYANLQMAAEALYTFRAKQTPNQTPGDLNSMTGHFFNQAVTPDILTTGIAGGTGDGARNESQWRSAA